MHRLRVVWVIALALVACGDERERPGGATMPTVPTVTGMPRSQAECVLAGAGLRWRAGGDRRVHGKPVPPCTESGVAVAPDPTVRRQRPPAGHAPPKSRVVVLEDDCTLLRFEARDAACL